MSLPVVALIVGTSALTRPPADAPPERMAQYRAARLQVIATIDRLPRGSQIVVGDGGGVSNLVRLTAFSRGLAYRQIAVNHARWGARAAVARNTAMVQALLTAPRKAAYAFPAADFETWDCIRQLRAVGIPVTIEALL